LQPCAPEPGSPRTGLCPWGGEPALSLRKGLAFETWETSIHKAAGSVVAQSHHGVDARSSTGRNVSGQQRNAAYQQHHGGECERVAGSGVE